jgi:hypothetical protein
MVPDVPTHDQMLRETCLLRQSIVVLIDPRCDEAATDRGHKRAVRKRGLRINRLSRFEWRPLLQDLWEHH